eukprot:TRINITY_DN411_c0_g1_i2.p1 TRINITY_DN411_c0_g1~~TRINITY_DN411_c0_g1_i2.p1  ORF type:complete len:482 (+),score=234.77 TRINITY_DN411_c0_g1_i2:65-1510(+)
MVLDIALFREHQGGNPEMVRESQRRRCKDPKLVDAVIELDREWVTCTKRREDLKKWAGVCSKQVSEKKKKEEESGDLTDVPEELKQAVKDNKVTKEDLEVLNATTLVAFAKEINGWVEEADVELAKAAEKKEAALKLVGNIVHESCKATDDEDQNEVVRTWGEIPESTEDTWNHVDLMELLGMETGEQASKTAGNRAYFLTGDLVLLQLGLINYAMQFLVQKGYEPFYPPFFMNKGAMAKVAELAQFDEELYHVSGEGDDKYLIATSEQPLCAYHANKWFQESELKKPKKYAGYSTCFRKEAGSHGRDTLGIFRVHQFEKIEQFMVCTPKDGESWKMLEEMIGNSEDFYKSLGLPYRVVEIVAGALNLAAAKKYDLEGYFPGSKTYRELVSCSNCTDYQARPLNTRYGASTKGTAKDEAKGYVHMLNGTMCAITRTMCCLVENHQTAEGINIPEPLRPFLGGKDFLKFSGPKVKKAEPKKK